MTLDSQARLTLTVRFPAASATRLQREEPKPGATLDSTGSEYSFSTLSSTLVIDEAEFGHGLVKMESSEEVLDTEVADVVPPRFS